VKVCREVRLLTLVRSWEVEVKFQRQREAAVAVGGIPRWVATERNGIDIEVGRILELVNDNLV